MATFPASQVLEFVDKKLLAEPQDRVFKVRPLIKKLNKDFATVLDLGNNVVIDDDTMVPHGMVDFRSDSIFKEKSISMESSSSRPSTKDCYKLNVDVYARKCDRQDGVGLSQDVCLKLMQNYKGIARTLHIDNFYMSLALVLCLLIEYTFISSTVNSTRKGLPSHRSEVPKGSVTGLNPKMFVCLFVCLGFIGAKATWAMLRQEQGVKGLGIRMNPRYLKFVQISYVV